MTDPLPTLDDADRDLHEAVLEQGHDSPSYPDQLPGWDDAGGWDEYEVAA
ncbi:hypothetical protein [Paractinoplanes maris]|nr:hypothetical protein [Actinoplanes maris]